MVYAEINGKDENCPLTNVFKMFHAPNIFVQYNIMEY